MDVTTPRQIRDSNLCVDPLGFGAGHIAHPNISNEQALSTVTAAWDSGIRFFDTAPFYGLGRSERCLGMGLSGVLRPGATPPRREYRVNTKVGKALVPEPVEDPSKDSMTPGGHVKTVRDPLSGFRLAFDYSGDAILQQHQDSLQRMGLCSVDSLTIHDLDPGNHSPVQIEQCLTELSAEGGEGSTALHELRASGVISAIGCGVSMDNRTSESWVGSDHEDLCERIADLVDLDFFLIAGPYTLLDVRATRKLLPLCEARGTSVVIGAPYSSGLLVTPDDPNVTYMYATPPKDMLMRANGMPGICERHGVPLAAAAIQFPLAHPAVVSVIPGARAPQEPTQNCEYMHTDVPQKIWQEFKKEGLLDPDIPTPTES